MSDDTGALLHRLCGLAGLATRWCDIFGKHHDVAHEDLGRILAALGLKAESASELRDRIEELEQDARTPPPLVTAELSAPLTLPVQPGRWRIDFEQGGSVEGEAWPDPAGCRLDAPDRAGYHRLEIAGREITLAVAPARCFTVSDALGHGNPRGWGLALQLYSLRRSGDGGVGDYAALAEFAAEVGSKGASALAISPVHAQFSADPDRFSP